MYKKWITVGYLKYLVSNWMAENRIAESINSGAVIVANHSRFVLVEIRPN